MPLGIAIGRYSTHEKISTECSDDTETPDTADNDPLPARFIGQQNVPLYNSKNISGLMHQIYHKNYSPLKINLKKYELDVDVNGITVSLAAAKKCQIKHLFMKYSLTDILLVTSDFQHDRLFAIIFYGPLRNCVLHLYLFNNDEDVRTVMNKCNEEFAGNREIKQVEKCPYSDGLEIIHYKPYEKSKDQMGEGEERNGTESTDHSNITDTPPVLQNPPSATIDPPMSSGEGNNSTTPYTYTPTQTHTPSHTLLEFKDFKVPYTNGKPIEPLNASFGEFQRVPTANTPVNSNIVKQHMNGNVTKPQINGNIPKPQINGNIPKPQINGNIPKPLVNGNIVKPPMNGNVTIPPANGNTDTIIPESPEEKPTKPNNGNYRNGGSYNKGNLLDDDELDDEFAELALKRNVYLPDHMQDKSIESTLLFPDTSSNTPKPHNIKPGLFSSYNKLSS